MNSSSAGTQAMKRMPVVMKSSGVFGIAALTSRSRSHGSSWWKRTDTAMWVLEVKSSAWKPTRSIVGAIASTSGVVRPVALQRLWLPSRVVVSTMSIVRLTRRTPPARASGSSPRRLSKSGCPSTPTSSARLVSTPSTSSPSSASSSSAIAPLAVVGVADQLGHQRVVVGRDQRAVLAVGVHAQAVELRHREVRDPARARA